MNINSQRYPNMFSSQCGTSSWSMSVVSRENAEGSLEEVKYFLILSKDLGYIPSDDDLMSRAETVGRLLHGLVASTERRR